MGYSKVKMNGGLSASTFNTAALNQSLDDSSAAVEPFESFKGARKKQSCADILLTMLEAENASPRVVGGSSLTERNIDRNELSAERDEQVSTLSKLIYNLAFLCSVMFFWRVSRRLACCCIQILLFYQSEFTIRELILWLKFYSLPSDHSQNIFFQMTRVRSPMAPR